MERRVQYVRDTWKRGRPRIGAPAGEAQNSHTQNANAPTAAAEAHADVLGGCADVAQEERLDRREQAETDAPEDLRAREQPDVLRYRRGVAIAPRGPRPCPCDPPFNAGFAGEFRAYVRPFTTPRARRSSNSRRARSSTPGSARTSIAVRASAFAATSAASSASGVTTWSRKAIEWPGIVSCETAMYGWIAGMTCMTFPMSVQPTRSSSRASKTC